jgi:hypothetical protein
MTTLTLSAGSLPRSDAGVFKTELERDAHVASARSGAKTSRPNYLGVLGNRAGPHMAPWDWRLPRASN